ncbi:MAG: small conductance mechanosensitive channel, partial [Rhodothermales bacterium]
NLAAGVITAVLRPFSIGDHVAVCDMDGEVIDIDVFHTTLVTLDNETIILPNADVVGGTVTNFSARDFVRVEVPVSVSLDADMDLVSTSLLVAAKTCKRVLEEPPPEVQIARFGTDAIEVQLEVSCLPLEISEG